MEVVIREQGGATVVVLRGALNAASAPDLRSRLEESRLGGARVFVVDLSDVPFIDSAGVATLVALFKRVRFAQGDIRLAGPQPRVDRLLRLLRLERVFAIFPDVTSALKGDAPASGA